MADSSTKIFQMRRNIRLAQVALYMDTCVRYGYVYIPYCNKWQTLVQKMSNEEKGHPNPIGPIYEHMHTIWSCLCTILQQMADSSAKICQMWRKVSQAQLALARYNFATNGRHKCNKIQIRRKVIQA